MFFLWPRIPGQARNDRRDDGVCSEFLVGERAIKLKADENHLISPVCSESVESLGAKIMLFSESANLFYSLLPESGGEASKATTIGNISCQISTESSTQRGFRGYPEAKMAK